MDKGTAGPGTGEAARNRVRYYEEAESWAADRERAATRQLRTAWLVAGAAATIALCEAIAIVALTPLKTVEPYTLLVDRQTGYVEALKPLERETVAPDRALTRSFLAQYVIARESFDISSLQTDYRKVALWSAGDARDRYIAGMQATNPASPLATLPRQALITVQIQSISSLKDGTALVRFTTARTDPGAQTVPAQHWAAVMSWKFSGEAMSAADRLINPLGFQVTRYRRDPETVPEDQPASAASPQALPGQVLPGRAAGVRFAPSTGAVPAGGYGSSPEGIAPSPARMPAVAGSGGRP